MEELSISLQVLCVEWRKGQGRVPLRRVAGELRDAEQKIGSAGEKLKRAEDRLKQI